MTDLAHQGNPKITEWCPRCACRVVPVARGLCGWCDYPVTGLARLIRQEYERRLTNSLRTRTRAIAAAKAAGGEISAPELASMLDVDARVASHTIKRLRRDGLLEFVGKAHSSGRPRHVYRLKGDGAA